MGDSPTMFIKNESSITSNCKMEKSKKKLGAKDIFLDLRVPVFINKNNGQWSVSIPKRKLKKLNKGNNEKEVPKIIPIRLFRWWK